MRFALPLLIGVITALQGALNRQVATHVGLGVAVILSTLGVGVGAIVLTILLRFSPHHLPAFFQITPGWTQHLAWWFALPGLLGILFVSGVPWAIHHFGAAHTFQLAIVGQIGLGLLWDTFVQQVPFTMSRAIGAALLIAGASLVLRGD